jgi:hypothetical protein
MREVPILRSPTDAPSHQLMRPLHLQPRQDVDSDPGALSALLPEP